MRSQAKQAMQLVLQDPNGATTGSAASAPQLRRHSSGCSPQDQLVIAASSTQDQLVIAASSTLRSISRDRRRSDGEHLPQENISSRRPSRALSIGSGSSRGDGSARRPSSSNDVSTCGTSRGGSPAPCRGGVVSGSPSRMRRMSNPNTGQSEDSSEAGGAANISLRTFGRTDTCAEQIAASAVKNELHNHLRASFVEASPESGEGPES